jgi:hypothetical protein
VVEVIVLAVLLGAWANLVADKVSLWVSEDETAGMAERYAQQVPFRK